MLKVYFYHMLISLICSWVPTCGIVLGSEAKDYYVFSEKGMKLRNNPSLESSSKAVLPYGAKISMIKPKASSEPLEVNRLSGYWSKVEALDPKSSTKLTGYMFSSYLLPYPPPFNRDFESPLKSYHQLLVKQGIEIENMVEQAKKFDRQVSLEILQLQLNSLQEAFVMAKRIYRMPDSFKFPSIYRNIYVKADVLDKKSDEWKIHELKIERQEDAKTIKLIHYSMKNYAGTIHAYLEPLKKGKFKFSEFFAPQGTIKQEDKIQKGSAKQVQDQKSQG